MRVLCAWCEKEGKPALLREVEPYDDLGETHGICWEHCLRLIAELTDVYQSSPHSVGEGTVMSELEDEARQRVHQWIEESQYLLGRVIPGMLSEQDRQRARADAAEQECDRLRHELGHAQAELTALRTENQTLQGDHAEVTKLLGSLTEHVTQMLQPMNELLVKLQATARRPA